MLRAWRSRRSYRTPLTAARSYRKRPRGLKLDRGMHTRPHAKSLSRQAVAVLAASDGGWRILSPSLRCCIRSTGTGREPPGPSSSSPPANHQSWSSLPSSRTACSPSARSRLRATRVSRRVSRAARLRAAGRSRRSASRPSPSWAAATPRTSRTRATGPGRSTRATLR